MLTSYWGYVNNLIIEYILKLAKGAFFNYVDKILAFFDHLATPGWHVWRNSFIDIKKNLHTVDISSTPPTFLVLST